MGSTEEVAQRVACKLRESGLAVDVLPARHVRSLESYGAVVLGAALYVGRLHKDARRFLAANRDLLIKLPVALFVLGPVQKDEKDWKGAQNQLEKQLRDFPWVCAGCAVQLLAPARLLHYQNDYVIPTGTTNPGGYGLGMMFLRLGKAIVKGHGGEVSGYSAALYLNRDAKVAVIVLSSAGGNGSVNVDALALRALEILSK